MYCYVCVVVLYITSPHMTPCDVFHCLLNRELQDLVVRNERKIFSSRGVIF